MSYSSTLGRWMQQDPAGYVDGISLYESYKSAPMTLNDPDGLETGSVGEPAAAPTTVPAGPTTRPSGPATTTCPATLPTTGPRPSDNIEDIVDRLDSRDRKERDKASQDLKKVNEKVIQDALDRPDWELTPEQRERLRRECVEQRIQRDADKLQKENATKPFGPFGPSGGMRR